MTTPQKIIKYFAIAFAFSLILGILSSIMFGISTISNFFDEEEDNISNDLTDINISSDDVSILDIDVLYTNLVIKEGDILKAETNNKNIITSHNENKLIIKEKKHISFNNDNDLIVYIPKDFIFDGVSIDVGAGNFEIDALNTKILELDLGAGKTNIENLYVLGSADIDGGAGDFSILNGEINNLDLDIGVGKTTLTSTLLGKSEIDAGVGKLDITLIGSKDDYTIKAEKGLGNIKLNNDSIKANKVFGTGTNRIDISGGVGSININISEN